MDEISIDIKHPRNLRAKKSVAFRPKDVQLNDVRAIVNTILSEWRDVRLGIADEGPWPTPSPMTNRQDVALPCDAPGVTVARGASTNCLSRSRLSARNATAVRRGLTLPSQIRNIFRQRRICNKLKINEFGVFPYNRTGPIPTTPKFVQQADEANAVDLADGFFCSSRRRLS